MSTFLEIGSVAYSLPCSNALRSEIARFGGVGVPGVVASLHVSSTVRGVHVEWKAPPRTAQPVTGYEVEYTVLGQDREPAGGRGDTKEPAASGKGAGSSCSNMSPLPDEGLVWTKLVINGKEYTVDTLCASDCPLPRSADVFSVQLAELYPATRYAVRVRAVNAAGAGLWETTQFKTGDGLCMLFCLCCHSIHYHRSFLFSITVSLLLCQL